MHHTSSTTKHGKRWLAAGAFTCVACCTLPLLAALTGSATLAVLAAHAESLGLGVLAAIALLWLFLRLRRPPACSTDCARRPPPDAA